MLLDNVPAGPAEALRPHPGPPSMGVQYLLPARHVVLAEPLPQAHSGADVGGQLGLEKGAHLSAKGLLFGGVFQVHGNSSILSLWHPATRHAVLSTTTN